MRDWYGIMHNNMNKSAFNITSLILGGAAIDNLQRLKLLVSESLLCMIPSTYTVMLWEFMLFSCCDQRSNSMYNNDVLIVIILIAREIEIESALQMTRTHLKLRKYRTRWIINTYCVFIPFISDRFTENLRCCTRLFTPHQFPLT